jgi:hypothetical protein
MRHFVGITGSSLHADPADSLELSKVDSRGFESTQFAPSEGYQAQKSP